MFSLSTMYLQIYTWHLVTNSSTLNKSPYCIPEIQYVWLLQYNQIINTAYTKNQFNELLILICAVQITT